MGLRTDDVDSVGVLGGWNADEEVVGFDIAVDEGLFMDGLYTSNLCVCVSVSHALPGESNVERSAAAMPNAHMREEKKLCSPSASPPCTLS